jgi:O-antigen/teichoic acid export membrane protein
MALKVIGFSAARVMPAAASMAFVGVFVKSLGVSHYAYLTLALAIANSSAAFCSGWIAQALLRYLPGLPIRDSSTREALRASLVVSCIAVLTISAVGMLLLEPTEVGRSLFPSVYLLAAAMMLQNVQLARLMVSGRSVVYAASEFARAILFLALAICLAMVGRITLTSAVWINVACYSVSTIILRLALKTKRRPGVGADKVASAAKLRSGWIVRFWRFGSPMSVWLGTLASLPLIDRAILIARAGAPVAGTYSASYDLFYRVASFLFAPVLMVFHPHVMGQANLGQVDGAYRKARLALVAALLVSLPVSAVLALGAGRIGGMLGMQAQQLPYRLAFLLTLGGCLWQCGLFAQKFLEIQKRTDTLLIVLVAAVGIQAALVATLAPEHGAIGAAVAGIAGALAYSITCYAWGSRLAREPTARWR